MLMKHALAIALLATTSLVRAEDTGKKDPQTGKDCVTYFSSEAGTAGVVHMNFRNICGSPFQIRVMGSEHTREGTIGPGSPASPSRGYVACSPEDRCEASKWQYQ